MFALLSSILYSLSSPTKAQPLTAPLADDGTVPVWLTAGPFDQPVVGFGVPADADVIGEAEARPSEGQTQASAWAAAGTVTWRPAAPDSAGFVDFHAAFADVAPGDGPERIAWAKAGYAYTTLVTAEAQEVLLLAGSNSRLAVFLDGERVHAFDGDRNAVADQDTVRLRLRAGPNRLLVKVGQSHQNEAVQFFAPLEWQWGFYLRLVRPDGAPAESLPRPVGVEAEVVLDGQEPEAALAPSFFFRETPAGLRQRFDLTLTRRTPEAARGEARLTVNGEAVTAPLGAVPFGVSRHALWAPAVEAPAAATLEVRLDGGEPLTQQLTLEPQPRYELHLMLNAHTDVGYTHPQPTVAEKHALLLDEVIERAEREPDFRWTIETVWQLEQFANARAPEQVERLMALVRAGRAAVSASYSNPFTGWVSEEELLRSFAVSHGYAERYGFGLRAALANDEPGFSWMLPGVLAEMGVPLLVAGLNESFSDYAFQRSLPKVFRWEGADGRSVVTYRTEAYNEGQTYGLVKGVEATADRMRERLQRLRAQGHPYDLVLLNTTFADNGPIPVAELEGARAWNAQYAYPRVVVSTLDQFAEAFLGRYGDDLPIVRGDWTSDWDVLSQGEPARVVRQRWAQHHLPAAEAMSTAAWLTDGRAPLQPLVDEAYRHLLQYSAHGSGLEYGYGGPKENAVTVAYREGYVQDAVLATEAALQRATQRLVHPLEAFETEAVFVFNALGAERDAPVEVEFAHDPSDYRVVDGATGAELPSHAEGHVLRFVARDLPGLGYKKLRLEPRAGGGPPRPGRAPSDLRIGPAAIENAFYRLEADPATGALVSVRDHRSGAELVRAGAALPFGAPVRAVFGDPTFVLLPADGVTVAVVDERPARLRLVAEHPGAVVQRVTYTLWEGLDRVDVEAAVNLEALRPVEAAEEYGLAFPFALDDPGAHPSAGSPRLRSGLAGQAVGVLGGFVEPTRDRFEAIRHDAFSLRQSLALSDAEAAISWAAVDTRVVRLRAVEGEAAPTVVAVVANHFPASWNRNEENEGVWPLRFAFTRQPGGFDPAFTDAFGRGLTQPPVAYPTWLTAAEPARDFLRLDGDAVHLMAFQPGEDGAGVLVRLRNPRPDADAALRVSLPEGVTAAERVTFLGEHPTPVPLDGGAVPVRLGPNEIATFRLHTGNPTPHP
jgi:hypothetical protein